MGHGKAATCRSSPLHCRCGLRVVSDGYSEHNGLLINWQVSQPGGWFPVERTNQLAHRKEDQRAQKIIGILWRLERLH